MPVKVTCPVQGCTHTLQSRYVLVCIQHWRKVPKDLQAELNAAWDARKSLECPETRRRHTAAKMAVLNYLNRQSDPPASESPGSSGPGGGTGSSGSTAAGAP